MSQPTARSLRPGAESFRRAGWLPKSQEAADKFFADLKSKTRGGFYSNDQVQLLHPVQEFKNFIENNPTVYCEFIRMFENIPEKEHPNNYTDLINSFNEIFRKAPEFGSLGPPVYMVMANIMNTQGGFSAFTKEGLNHHFKQMFETWQTYLMSKESRSVLVDAPGGWLTATALQELLRYYAKGRTFDQVFKCNPEEDYYGYKSYEEFFNRQYANVQTDRPTGPIEDLRIIGTPCESVTYCYQENLKVMDELFIKDEAYSLRHLLADNYVEYFKGGTALQSFLNTPDYHRWHAPCNGIIKKIVPVAGTYFAQSPDTIGLPTNPTGKNDPAPPYLQSLTFFANTATRALIFIEAENPKLGCVCFIGIGMTEISSCEATVYEGQKVVRGDELGMFHFGGSSCLILFRKDANVQVDKEYKVPDTRMEINKPFATCDF